MMYIEVLMGGTFKRVSGVFPISDSGWVNISWHTYVTPDKPIATMRLTNCYSDFRGGGGSRLIETADWKGLVRRRQSF